jgi:ankyrin repeat protein
MDAVWQDAVTRGDLETVRATIEAGVDVDSRDRYGQTALMLAAHEGHDAVVEMLIARGAALDVTAKWGLSALMLAIVAGHQGVARRLARAGADLTLTGTGGTPGFGGKTAHDLARDRGMDALASELRALATP